MKRLCLFILGLFALSFVPSASAYTTNMSASVVIGQPSFATDNYNYDNGVANSRGLNFPYGVSVINGKVFVGDFYNHRQLIWNSIPTTNGSPADVVIGQPNMTSDSDNQGGTVNARTLSNAGPVASDGTKLFVSDYSNHRVLIFNRIPTSNNAAADVVIGQPDMTTNSTGASATKMNLPWGIFYDQETGKLFIADYQNSRVLIYNSVPTRNGAAADVVLGQADFTGSAFNRGGSAHGGTMIRPYYAKVINRKLVVADRGNNRVLVWNTIPTVNGTPADYVIGQPNLTSVDANQGGSIRANTLFNPSDIEYSNGEFFIQDQRNNRILIYNGLPTTSNTSAYKVLGQSNFTSGSENPGGRSAKTFFDTDGGMTIYGNQLFVVDNNNYRVLIFNTTQIPLAASPEISIADTTATVSWETTNPMSSLIDYGTNSSYGFTTGASDTSPTVRQHRLTLTGLTPCKTYHYRISSNASNSDTAFSENLTFNTKGTCSSFSSEWRTESGTVKFEPAMGDNLKTDNYPTFVFTRARDDQNGISKYQIVISDSKGMERVLIDSIPDTGSQTVENEDRYLFYDGGEKITVKGKAEKYRLENGAYRWRVRAINGKGIALQSSSRTLLVNTNSAVFSDSNASFPLMLLQAGNAKLSYASYSPTSVKPVTVGTSKPTFYGITNVGAHVKLILTKGSDTYTFEVNANDQSRFGINVNPALPKGTYNVNLSATNDSGDYVTLPGFEIKI